MVDDFTKAIFHPALNLSTLTDEDLSNKSNELSRRIAFATRSFQNQDVLNQLYSLMNVIATEQSERIERERYAMRENLSPKIIETEPDLKISDVKKDVPSKREDVKKRSYVPIILKHWKKTDETDPNAMKDK